MWSKLWFFKNFLNLNFFKLLHVVHLDNSDCFWAFTKNRMSKKNFPQEIFIHKGQILPENDQSGVQRSLYISRTVYAMENLIWYSESTINFLSLLSHQIFVYLSSSGWKFDAKTVNFNAFFEWFFGIFSATTWKILIKLGQKWDKMDTKQTQKTRR